MNHFGLGVCLLLCGFSIPWIWRCWNCSKTPSSIDEILHGIDIQPELENHTKNLGEKEVIKVTDGVYVAVNYAIANSIMLEGPEGLIIVDTTESREAANEILTEFRAITSKPILAIIYTHSHGDHVYGAGSFIEDPDQFPDIWAFHTMPSIWKDWMVTGLKLRWGAVHQFGTRLGQYRANCGLGIALLNDGSSSEVAIPPNKLIYNEYENMIIAGLNISFVHVPGETQDQIAVWLPERNILLAADDIYKTFPNLYAIRGTAPRDSLVWAQSIRKMRDLHPEIVVPSHMKPIYGRQEIYEIFTVYMSGIQYIHDQTVRRMNQLYHPDEIAKMIKLPKSLASHPYMQQFYGTTGWSAKGTYERYVGWFSGDPVDLQPFTPVERSERMIRLVGLNKLLDQAETALKSGDLQWALELSSHVFRVHPDNYRAKDLRLQSLRALASIQTNPLSRNYYMTTALIDFNFIHNNVDISKVVDGSTMEDLLHLMKIRLVSELAEGINMTLYLKFDDTKEQFRLQVLHSVLTVDRLNEEDEVPDDGNSMELKTTTAVWKQLLQRQRSSALAYATGDLQIKGSLLKVRQFFLLFIEP